MRQLMQWVLLMLISTVMSMHSRMQRAFIDEIGRDNPRPCRGDVMHDDVMRDARCSCCRLCRRG